MMPRDRKAGTVPGMILGIVLIGGCESASGAVDEPLSEIIAEAGDTTVIRVAVAPLDIGVTGNHRVTELRSDLDLVPAEVSNVIDVATFADGRVAVLTPENVQVFSPEGELLTTLGRKGSGPGEFRYPVALVTVGRKVAVLQVLANRGILSVFDGSTGQVLRTEEVGAGGDWMSYLNRGPALFQDFPARSGTEDWSRRLSTRSDSSIVAYVQPPEPLVDGADSVFKVPGYLLRLPLGNNAVLMDTMVTLESPPSVLRAVASERRPATFWEVLYQPRSLWTSGSGWWGTIERGDTVLEVRTDAGRIIRFIWPARRVEVSEADRKATSRYGVSYVARTFVRSRARLRQLAPREQREQYKKFMTFFPFARWRPQATALLHAGGCALVAGFDPASFTDGTATAWLRINVREGRVLDVLRVRARDARTLHADGRGVYMRVFGEDDLPHVVRWRFPDEACFEGPAPGAAS